jgi:hypothetical protein
MAEVSHDYHEEQPNFHHDQVLKDGCGECRQRSLTPYRAIGAMDPTQFTHAWQRAIDWQKGRIPGAEISDAEAPVLQVLWAVAVQLDNLSNEHVAGLRLLPLNLDLS